MDKNLQTIEDCLEVVAGLTSTDNFVIDDNDKTIIHSIARQVFKGTALTDRQCLLMKQKLNDYFTQFLSYDYTNYEVAIHELRQPLRQIDRRKYIKISDTNEREELNKDNSQWIVIRFPFSKKAIIKLEKVANKFRKYYTHKKGSHKHYFKIKENIVYELISTFKNNEFVIDQNLLDMYKEVEIIKQEPSNYVPGLWNGKIKNISKSGTDFIESKINKLSELQLFDRRRLYGLNYITHDIDDTLPNFIAHREWIDCYIDNETHSLQEVCDSLLQLDRLPLLVLLDTNEEYAQLSKVHTALSSIPTEEQTVLFRTENKTENDKNFNHYIHKNNLNNWFDTNTKVLYLSKQKLPKILFTVDWKPMSVLCLTSTRINTIVSVYMNDTCDLHVYHEKNKSIFWRSNSAYM